VFCKSLCIRGYHVYNEIWTAVFGVELHIVVDQYVMAVTKDSVKLWNTFQEKNSRLCSMFMEQSGYSLGNRRNSSGLVQGEV